MLNNFTLLPLCLAAPRYSFCEEIGNAIAEVVASRGEPIGILASSDLNHYENQEVTLRKDQRAIDAVLALDPEGLWRVVAEEDISMCGFIPTTTMLIAAEKLGATSAKLIKHATSGDVKRDSSHVVGYAAMLL